MSWQQPTVSERCKATGLVPEHFTGRRFDCEACGQPFRTFRDDVDTCSACRSRLNAR